MAFVPVIAKVKESASCRAPEGQAISAVGALGGFFCVLAGMGVTVLFANPAPAVIGVVCGVYLLFAIKVAKH